MKLLLLSTAFLALTWAIPFPATLHEEWNQYKKSFGKFYTSDGEDVKRLNAYLATKQRVDEHNRKYEKGETSYTMGMNEFADWFPEEFNKMNGLKLDENELKERNVVELPPGVEVPDEIDWVKKGAVTRAKLQGLCGCSYAFSAIGALEGLMFITNKTITHLSAQELVDCTRAYGNLACLNGSVGNSFTYVAANKGISTDESYPYEAREWKCRAREGEIAATCTGHKTLIASEDEMKKAVGTIGPVSVSFQTTADFYSYKDGVFDGECGVYVNHAMLIVGYGKDEKTGKDYWLVKNSWGRYWGMDGFAKIIRGVGKCGINLASSYPIFDRGSKQ